MTARRPLLCVVVGPNGSGKSSITRELKLSPRVQYRFVNPDLIAETLDISDPVERGIEAARIAESERRSLLAHRVSFGFETVGSVRDKLDFIAEAKACGYLVELYFVTTADPRINIGRVRSRVEMGGHDVDDGKVVSRYRRTMAMLCEYVDVADRAVVIDNSGEHPAIVFIKNGEDTRTIRNPGSVPWLEALLVRHPSSDRTLEDPDADRSLFG